MEVRAEVWAINLLKLNRSILSILISHKPDHMDTLSIICNFNQQIPVHTTLNMIPSYLTFVYACTTLGGISRSQFSDSRVNDLAAAILEVQQDIDSLGPKDDLLNKEADIKRNFFVALRIRESFWRDKSRLRWLAEGDWNSSFFYRTAKLISARTRIHVLKYGNKVFQLDFDNGLTEQVIPSLVTEEDDLKLTSISSAEEIQKAVFDMDPQQCTMT
ncbi:hypothetical protein L1049_021989 [Liquidambar formosana]|uniref:Uncharacterized protein n=1 Tax=Liquidambar formosana TaxID=63359 RepID=A0AAP0RDS0_LIQFO